MLITLVKNEFLKQKRNLLIWVILLIPVAVAILLSIDYTIRYESWLAPLTMERGMTSWQMLIKEQRILYFNDFMPLFSAIIVGELMESEYKNNGWTFLLTKPIERWSVLLSKYLTSIIYLLIMLFVNVILLIALGKILNFPESIPWSYFLIMIIIQLVASASVMVIHLFLSIKNKNILISFGIAAILSIISSNLYYNKDILSNVNPYGFTLYSLTQGKEEQVIIYIISGILIIGGFIILNKYFKLKKEY